MINVEAHAAHCPIASTIIVVTLRQVSWHDHVLFPSDTVINVCLEQAGVNEQFS